MKAIEAWGTSVIITNPTIEEDFRIKIELSKTLFTKAF
ncbi:hypothetical protein LEP1GSC074_1225 [Leptospira noguchii str. Hook]|nr:hypothetical protein LEP1GSC041_3532 [Leptospira noguchii str. 2006001870]EMS87142.1 hypothetical protein LEP1GSC074_1225 [Leptospira noguchii str. Hook]